MFKKTQLTIFAAIVLSCSFVHGQGYTTITPSSLGFASQSGPINDIFDLSPQFNLSANSLTLEIANGHVADGSDFWAVSESQPATFTIGGSMNWEGFVQHGPNLGSPGAQNGSASVDGFIASTGQDWTLISSLDSDYTASQSGDNYFITYSGDDTGNVERNTTAFRWTSDQDISGYQVYSTNTTDLDNNYAIGFRQSTAVPEPSTMVMIAVASTLCLIRRKRN